MHVEPKTVKIKSDREEGEMSDREGSPSRSRSRSLSYRGSPALSDKLSDVGSDQGSPQLSPAQRSRSRSRSKASYKAYSRSPSRSYKRYSRSSSHGRSRKYYSRSRSRSPYYKRRSRYSRSRSRSYSPAGRRHHSDSRRHRSHSRSPMSRRRRHKGSRENPKTSRCLGVFGLSLYTQERDLRDVFSRYGPLEDVQIVYDHQTGRSRGFSFIYFRNLEDAEEAKERASGLEIDGRKIRIDYSITERAHTPTPGIYLGKPTSSYRSSRRSPSPYYGRTGGRRDYYSRSRSRSRSYTPH